MIKLFAPLEYGEQPCCYHQAGTDLINETTGGCGPGGVGDYFVPDHLLFVSIKECCRLHDWLYKWGRTIEDKKIADRVFLNNMLRTIGEKRSILNSIRRRRAKKYYLAVKWFGGPVFWSGKNQLSEVV